MLFLKYNLLQLLHLFLFTSGIIKIHHLTKGTQTFEYNCTIVRSCFPEINVEIMK